MAYSNRPPTPGQPAQSRPRTGLCLLGCVLPLVLIFLIVMAGSWSLLYRVVVGSTSSPYAYTQPTVTSSAGELTSTAEGTHTPEMSREQQALEHANRYRQLAGIAPLRIHPAITQAAQSHADYYAINKHNHAVFPKDEPLSAHGEVTEQPGFTGVQFWDRLQHAGYPGDLGSEVMAFYNTPITAVDSWMASVYHRLPFVDPRINEAGYGAQDGDVDVMDFGISSDAPAVDLNQVSVYPANGMKNIPRGWDCWEAPNPYADTGCSANQPVGYVITVLPMGQQQFRSLRLATAAGQQVPIHALRHDERYKCWYAAAQQPLAANTSYTTTLTGTDNDGKPMQITVSFTTGDQMYQVQRET